MTLAHRLFAAARVLFEAAGDASNAAMVRCNLSSLLRMQAMAEMNAYRQRALRKVGVGSVGGDEGEGRTRPSDPTSALSDGAKVSKIGKDSKSVNGVEKTKKGEGIGEHKVSEGWHASPGMPRGAAECAYDAYQRSYHQALKYLKEAQRHCDHAVWALDNVASESGAVKAGTPSGQSRIRSVVASETAQTFLSIGILKKDDVFKSYAFEKMNLQIQPKASSTVPAPPASTATGTAAGAASGIGTATTHDSSVVSLEEKERAVLSALETGENSKGGF